MSHVLYTPDTAQWPEQWDEMPAENIVEGTPKHRMIEFGEFRGGPLGVWQLTPGLSGGVADEPELIVILDGGDTTFRLSDGEGHTLAPGTTMRVDIGSRDSFEVRETMTEFWFYPPAGGGENTGEIVTQITAELTPDNFFTDEQRGGLDVHTAIKEIGTIEGVAYGIWEMGAGAADWVTEDEVFIIESGKGTLTFEDGEVVDLAPGTVVRLVDGEKVRWDISEQIRKVWIG